MHYFNMLLWSDPHSHSNNPVCTICPGFRALTLLSLVLLFVHSQSIIVDP